ncbi:heat shock protein Hsp20 [Novymonas esmeraldas]|uniref:Heat shock protein Hsp20 n=1 Tax=Novymonas esmeraldas TaxID=1808958 RepID=A0AAW0EZV4_9TRYP
MSGEEASASPAASGKKNNSYYYWHGHEKERAKVGDVAPMPTPHLVARDDALLVAAPTVPTASVSKYSWCDGDRYVSVYIDTVGADGGTLDESSISMTYTTNSFAVTFRATDAGGKECERRLAIRLSKRVAKDKCTMKVKPKTQQILVRLAKKVQSVWLDLEGAASDRDSEADGDVAETE